MTLTRPSTLVTVLAVTICSGWLLAATAQPAQAQDKQEKGAAPKATAQEPAQATPDKAQAGQPAAAKSPTPTIKPRHRRSARIPEPTVVLKPGEEPKIKFDALEYNFGRVRAGEPIRHDFWFTNEGTGPLEILRVKPSCGCTTAGQHDRIVQPGESGKIPIKLSTTKFSGRVTKTVTVNTNCQGEGSTVTLRITGELWQAVQVTPRSASFGRLQPDQAHDAQLVRKLTIVNNVDGVAEITDLHSTNPMFNAEVKTIEPGKKFELIVSVVPPLNPGSNYGKIEFNTGIDEMPKLQVSVSAFVLAEVQVTPNKLLLPADRTADMTRQVYVQNNSKNPVHLSDVAVSNPALTLETKETRPGKMFQLTLNIPADYKVPPGGDKITLKTDNATAPEITIPIIQRIPPRAKSVLGTTGTKAAPAKPKGAQEAARVQTLTAEKTADRSAGSKESKPADGTLPAPAEQKKNKG